MLTTLAAWLWACSLCEEQLRDCVPLCAWPGRTTQLNTGQVEGYALPNPDNPPSSFLYSREMTVQDAVRCVTFRHESFELGVFLSSMIGGIYLDVTQLRLQGGHSAQGP